VLGGEDVEADASEIWSSEEMLGDAERFPCIECKGTDGSGHTRPSNERPDVSSIDNARLEAMECQGSVVCELEATGFSEIVPPSEREFLAAVALGKEDEVEELDLAFPKGGTERGLSLPSADETLDNRASIPGKGSTHGVMDEVESLEAFNVVVDASEEGDLRELNATVLDVAVDGKQLVGVVVILAVVECPSRQFSAMRCGGFRVDLVSLDCR
jgi:hypothetical protein